MAQMAAMSRMVIHHGGVGTCETLLGLGRPQFIFPRHVEQRLNAKILVASGIADSIPSIEDVNLSEAHAKMQKVAHDDALAQRARNIGKGLAARPHASLDTIVANCIELLP
jgi:UDP:flavonoid glycosyltransferase YjiC (YdhE family)